MTHTPTLTPAQKPLTRRLLLFCMGWAFFLNTALAQDPCNPDVTPPTCQAPPSVTVSCENFDYTLADYGTATAADACCLSHVNTAKDYSLFDTLCNKGTIKRLFVAYDCSGNASPVAEQNIVVNYLQEYFIKFPDDRIVTVQDPIGNYGFPQIAREDCELVATAYTDEVFVQAAQKRIYIKREWAIINWCTWNPENPVITVPNPNPNSIEYHASNLPGPTVSPVGTQAPWAPTLVKITPGDPAPTDYASFYQQDANRYNYIQHIYILDTLLTRVQGYAFQDENNSCAKDTGEAGLASWQVQAVGNPSQYLYEVMTDATGYFNFGILPGDVSVELSLVSAVNVGQNCPGTYVVPVGSGQTSTQDLPASLIENCPLLSVDISTPFLRRCFNNNYYIHACNISANTVTGTYVEVTLDPHLSYVSSSIPGTDMGNGVWRFVTGSMAAGACLDFFVKAYLSCDAEFSATHCTEANIYPQVVCDGLGNWNGADLRVSGSCEGNDVHLQIRNVGQGNMQQALDFVVVEDVIMREQTPFQLNSGAVKDLYFPANGATWYLSAPQPANHPFGGQESVSVEGCGGLNTIGLVGMFPFNSPNPFNATDCTQNQGSYDPNDKQGFPTGYGAEHYIKPNVNLDYLIRFQNTGTDTAFTVVILDTLSAALNTASIRPGASSHPYTFSLIGDNVLRFRFDNILLPDSNVNEAASHGFIRFNIAQVADNPDDTRIENDAAIYFDFNAPVITNTTLHTVKRSFLSVSVDEADGNKALHAYPNPTRDFISFDIPEVGGQFVLFNALGQEIRQIEVRQSPLKLNCSLLTPGVYYYQIIQKNAVKYSGKVLKN